MFIVFFSQFTSHLLSCLSQTKMAEHIACYRLNNMIIIKEFEQPNTFTKTFLKIGISDVWEYFE